MAGYCVLEFASLAELLAVGEAPSTPDTRSCLSAVLDAANACTDSLTVIVRVSSDSVNPWQPAAPSSSSSSSSSSASAVVGAAPLAHPTALFLPLERALARLYSVPTDSFVARDLVTAATTVVLEQLRNSPVCVPDSAHRSARWNANQPGRAVTASDDNKGKARQAVDQKPAPRSGSDALRAPSATSLPRLFDVVALGGTFDHLHSGHKILLTMAASITARKLIVGVSDDALLTKKKYREWLEPLDVRIRHVEDFVALVRPEIECACVPLQDVYGPTADDPEVAALVVSDETRAGGEAINTLRTSHSLQPLRVFCISLVAGDAAEASAADTLNRDRERERERVEVSAATKMGSTGIREWLARRRQAEEEEGEAEKEKEKEEEEEEAPGRR
ncbi:hypothetical protein JCM8202_002869 [Rhodotorula sphaerocarpa]